MRSKRYSTWTYEEKLAVIAEYQNGHPIEVIAKQHNFTVHQVYKFLFNSGVINDLPSITDINEKITKPAQKSQYYSDILRSLAGGINPLTGEEFNEGILDQADIIRALYAGAMALENREKILITNAPVQQQKSEQKPQNSGARWTEEEDEILIEAFNNGESIDQLALDFGRSEYAIARRIEKLHEITPEEIIKTVMQNRSIRHPN